MAGRSWARGCSRATRLFFSLLRLLIMTDLVFQVCSPGQLNLRHHRLGSEEPRLNRKRPHDVRNLCFCQLVSRFSRSVARRLGGWGWQTNKPSHRVPNLCRGLLRWPPSLPGRFCCESAKNEDIQTEEWARNRAAKQITDAWTVWNSLWS